MHKRSKKESVGIHMEIRELIFRGFHPCDGPDTIVVDGEKVKIGTVFDEEAE